MENCLPVRVYRPNGDCYCKKLIEYEAHRDRGMIAERLCKFVSSWLRLNDAPLLKPT